MVDANVLEVAHNVDVLYLAQQHSSMRKVSATEWAGPCPKCGGDDRFHAKVDGWFCRKCHPQFGDAIDFVQWIDGSDFKQAVSVLAGVPGASPHMLTRNFGTQAQPQKAHTERSTPTWDAADVLSRLHTYQAAMDDSPAAAYLTERGLCPETWQAYRFGYRADYNAVVVPWYRTGTLIGVNYRRLGDVEKGRRFVSETGSVRSGVLFGAQALVPNMHQLMPNGTDPLACRYLFVAEGELNAASIYQAAYAARVDVLSTGAEGNTIPDSFLPIAARYRTCIVWKDKEVLARAEAKRIAGASAYWSELAGGGELDANDHLQHGTLGVLVAHILKHAVPVGHHEALRYDLWDGGIG